MNIGRFRQEMRIDTQHGCVILVFFMVFVAVFTLKNPIIGFSYKDANIYTGIIHDYKQIMERYGTTYYANRVAFTVPARLTVAWLGDDLGHVALKIMHLGAVSLSAFALGRRYYSQCVGVAAAAWAAFNPWIIRALDWDYVDGVAITYGIVGFCCFLASRKRKMLFHALGGAILAFACNTNAFMAFIAMTLIPTWLLLRSSEGPRRLANLAIAAILGFIAGYAIICLIQFIEFPELGFGRELKTIIVGLQLMSGGQTTWFQPLSDVMGPPMAYLFMPLTLLIVVACLSAVLSSQGGISRFAVAAMAFLSFCLGLFFTFHYALHSPILISFFYFSYLFIPTLFVVIALLGEVFYRLQPRFAVLACIAAILCFGFIWVDFDALTPLFTDQSALSLLLSTLVVGLALVIFSSPSIRAGSAIVACMLTISVFYNEASVVRNTPYYKPQAGEHLGEYAVLHSRGEAKLEHDNYEGAVFLQKIVAKTLPVQDGPVGFWYGLRPDGTLFNGIQSVFLWEYSNVISPELPQKATDRIDSETRRKLSQYRHIVILTRDEQEAEIAIGALAVDGSTAHIKATFVYRGDLLSYSATFVELDPAPAAVGAEVAQVPNTALTPQNGGSLTTEADGVHLLTDPHQWTYSASASLESLHLPPRPLILRVNASVTKGRIGVMVLGKTSNSIALGETPSVQVTDGQVIDVPIPDGSQATDVVLRNVVTGTSIATITGLTVYDAASAKR